MRSGCCHAGGYSRPQRSRRRDRACRRAADTSKLVLISKPGNELGIDHAARDPTFHDEVTRRQLRRIGVGHAIPSRDTVCHDAEGRGDLCQRDYSICWASHRLGRDGASGLSPQFRQRQPDTPDALESPKLPAVHRAFRNDLLRCCRGRVKQLATILNLTTSTQGRVVVFLLVLTLKSKSSVDQTFQSARAPSCLSFSSSSISHRTLAKQDRASVFVALTHLAVQSTEQVQGAPKATMHTVSVGPNNSQDERLKWTDMIVDRC